MRGICLPMSMIDIAAMVVALRHTSLLCFVPKSIQVLYIPDPPVIVPSPVEKQIREKAPYTTLDPGIQVWKLCWLSCICRPLKGLLSMLF